MKMISVVTTSWICCVAELSCLDQSRKILSSMNCRDLDRKVRLVVDCNECFRVFFVYFVIHPFYCVIVFNDWVFLNLIIKTFLIVEKSFTIFY